MEEVVVVPMEESIQSLLDHFVQPYLSNTKTALPSIAQHQFIAKQVHAVVLLYNYYLRKSHQTLEYLNLESFSKLAVVMKPNLMVYMKLMRQANYSEVEDLEHHLSETEKSIVDACNISLALDASKQWPNCQSWPISKVAILLTDASKDKCLLLLGTVTSGAWSLIEKSVDVIDMDCKDKIGGHRVYRRKKSTENKTKTYQNALEARLQKDAFEARLQKVAFAAIEEAAGINHTDLLVLENHDVYSLSKEKTATRFYIVLCAQPGREEFHISMKEVVDSLQGSLMKKKSSGWVVSPAVEYFHILPYAGIMRDWLSRKGLEDMKVESGIEHHNNLPLAVESYKTEFSDRKTSGQSSSSRAKVHDQQQNMTASDSHEHTSHAIMDKMRDSQKQNSLGLPVPSDNNELLPVSLNSKYMEKLHDMATKECALSQTALALLLKTREILSHQLHTIQDEIASCDREIQSMLPGRN